MVKSEKLLDEIMTVLKHKGVKFDRKTFNSRKSVVVQSQPTKLGSHVILHAVQNHLFLTVQGSKAKEHSIISNIDILIRKKMEQKFKLADIRVDEGSSHDPSKIAHTIFQALMFYEKAWEKIMSGKELDSLFNNIPDT